MSPLAATLDAQYLRASSAAFLLQEPVTMWSTVEPGGARFSGTAENCDVAPACAAAAAAQRHAALFSRSELAQRSDNKALCVVRLANLVKRLRLKFC